MKKYAATILLTVTGALMLVLSVLPHHHYGGVIHFGVTQCCETCQECPKDGKQETDATAHKHAHSHDSDTDCDLRQLFVISAREDQLMPLCPCDGPGDHPAFDHFTLTLLYSTSLPLSQTDETGDPLKFPPLTQPLGSLLGGNLFALRAPPFLLA